MDPTTTIPTPTTPPVDVPPAPLKTNWAVIILLPLFLLSLGLSVFLFYQNQALSKQIADLQTSQIQPTQDTSQVLTPTTDPTANWKTFINSKFGIQFKYPQDWYAKQFENLTFTVVLDDKNIVIPEGSDMGFPISVAFSEETDTRTNVTTFSYKTVEEAVNKFKTSSGAEISTDKSDLLIDGYKAAQLSGISGFGPAEGEYFKNTYIQVGDKVLNVSLGNKQDEAIYDQILSTFKFTN